MNWANIEKAFNRSIVLAFSRQKLFLTFPVLVLCGLLVVFCRALAFNAADWISLSLTFLPILLSAGILLVLGALLAKIHFHEMKSLTLKWNRLLGSSIDLITGTSYLSIPSLLIYLLFWIILGVFFLLREIGVFFSVVFSFGPFLLIFGSLILCFINLLLLFFVAPASASQTHRRAGIFIKKIFDGLKNRLFSAFILFFIALIPMGFVIGLLVLAALLTNINFSIAERSIAITMEWFFIMLPFAAVLSPATVFFFNFAAESHTLLQPSRDS